MGDYENDGNNNENNMKHNNDNDNGNGGGNNRRIRYCSLCHRSEDAAGGMIDLPGGLEICPDCMQKVMNLSTGMDYQKMMEKWNEGWRPTNDDVNRWMQGDFSHPSYEDTSTSSDNNSYNEESHAVANPSQENKGTSGTSYGSSADDEDEDEDKEHHRNSHPNVSFVNLGDIFGGQQQKPKVKKKKKKGPKPLFTSENIPAPHLLKAELDKYVIGQEKAKKQISVAAYNHYKRLKTGTMDEIEIEKSNILLIGPTGCGKTYLVQTLARLLDVPLAITDATNLTEAGYVGDDVESCISKLLAETDNDVEKAERGIVFIDEIDKTAKKKNINTRDISGEGVQQGLLKLLEGREVEVPVGASSKNGMVPTVMVDTTNILFICGGAFPTLEGIIKERLAKQSSFGFSAELRDQHEKDPNILAQVTNEDLRTFGMIPEFIGRLPIVCTLENLDEDMLVRILTEPKNAILKQYQKLLALDGVDLEFEDESLHAIARKALEKETGARGLRSIIEEFMMDIMYEIPKDKNIGRVTITADYVNGKGGPKVEIRQDLLGYQQDQGQGKIELNP